jgi:methionyl aminopeptidase
MNAEQLRKQKFAGQIAAQFFAQLETFIKPGVNLLEIEEKARKIVEQNDLLPAFLGYKGYPAVTCISVNSAIVHGIPHDSVLKDGDIVSVDIGLSNDGFLVDTAYTYGVGQISTVNERLLAATKAALDAAMKQCRVGKRVGDIGAAVQQTVEAAGFAIIPELTGHGVGKTLQEPPTIPNYGTPGKGEVLKAGMVLAVEPITAAKKVKIGVQDDGWTIVASEEVATAHFEHTVLIDDAGPVILTGAL